MFKCGVGETLCLHVCAIRSHWWPNNFTYFWGFSRDNVKSWGEFVCSADSGWRCRAWRGCPSRRLHRGRKTFGRSFWRRERPAPSTWTLTATNARTKTWKTRGDTAMRTHRWENSNIVTVKGLVLPPLDIPSLVEPFHATSLTASNTRGRNDPYSWHLQIRFKVRRRPRGKIHVLKIPCRVSSGDARGRRVWSQLSAERLTCLAKVRLNKTIKQHNGCPTDGHTFNLKRIA